LGSGIGFQPVILNATGWKPIPLDRLEAYPTRQAGSLSHQTGWKLIPPDRLEAYPTA